MGQREEYAAKTDEVVVLIQEYGKYLRQFDPFVQKQSLITIQNALSHGLADKSGYGEHRKGTL